MEQSWVGTEPCFSLHCFSHFSPFFAMCFFVFCPLTRFGQVGSGRAWWGQANAPRGMGVGGHDTKLCSLPLLEGRGSWGVKPPCLQPPPSRRMWKWHQNTWEEREKKDKWATNIDRLSILSMNEKEQFSPICTVIYLQIPILRQYLIKLFLYRASQTNMHTHICIPKTCIHQQELGLLAAGCDFIAYIKSVFQRLCV